MIGLGVPPSVSTSTGMYMILWSTAASTVMYLTYGTLNFEFGVWLAFWCSLGIISGVTLVGHLIRKSGRQSILVFFLVFMLALSAVLVGLDLGVSFISEDQALIDEMWTTGSICN